MRLRKRFGLIPSLTMVIMLTGCTPTILLPSAAGPTTSSSVVASHAAGPSDASRLVVPNSSDHLSSTQPHTLAGKSYVFVLHSPCVTGAPVRIAGVSGIGVRGGTSPSPSA